MIDNNIIQSLGAGSGIDTKNLTKQLTEIERAAPQNRIDSKRDKAESQISDFGLLSSALATLQDAAKVLTDPDGMFSKTASYTESTALVPTGLDTTVQPGSYNFTVEDIAASQSLTSLSFSDPTDAVGEGVLTFRFGNVAVDGAGAMLGTNGFTPDMDTEEVQITIDSENNSLEGLRDAINDADFGVQATIVNDGLNGYVLQITAESGVNNQLEISAAESGGTPTDNDNTGLSRFTFNETASQLTQLQAGADAHLTLNGLNIYRESNTIDDIVEGLSMDVLQAAPGDKVTITVSDDKAFAEQNIRAFVEAYNLFLDAVKPAMGITDQENDEGESVKVTGSLANDALAKSMMSQIRTTIASAVPGIGDASFSSLGAIGIRTELDGTMSIDEETFGKTMDKNFEDVQKLFAPANNTTDSQIFINSSNARTASGDYDVVVTTQPSKGSLAGGAIAAGFPNFETSGKTHEFTVDVNGVSSGTLALAPDVYASQDEMALALQSLINSDSTLAAANASVTVSYDADNNRFEFTSTKYGASSNVSITTASADLTADLGVSVATGTAGTTVAGTVNGVAAFGSGNVLLPSLGQPGEGLGLIIGENATSATVSFSRGFAGELEDLIDGFLGSKGLIATRETNLEVSLEDLDDDQEALDRRMTAYEERLMNQFIAMERILNGLNTSGGFIENLIDTLPFTAKNN
ncbi:flagellar filament capping protein FliD [Teredinibacter turnerae]|uniref:flagellar filament capping protein FliD n=1 Tax=Teredinibacter turnerae TaxID=2426 RepID=UPI000409937C|nr:flagellar filament capping protein FliD [Teredinibacter turnerae]